MYYSGETPATYWQPTHVNGYSRKVVPPKLTLPPVFIDTHSHRARKAQVNEFQEVNGFKCNGSSQKQENYMKRLDLIPTKELNEKPIGKLQCVWPFNSICRLNATNFNGCRPWSLKSDQLKGDLTCKVGQLYQMKVQNKMRDSTILANVSKYKPKPRSCLKKRDLIARALKECRVAVTPLTKCPVCKEILKDLHTCAFQTCKVTQDPPDSHSETKTSKSEEILDDLQVISFPEVLSSI